MEPAAFAGGDVVASVGQPIRFLGSGASPDDMIVEYAWDFDADGRSDFVSGVTAVTTHAFMTPGDYQCILTVRDSQGRLGRDTRYVTVTPEFADSKEVRDRLAPAAQPADRLADGIRHLYAVMINGSNEDRFWTDVQLTYDMLTRTYGLLPADIYLLSGDGKDPNGGNPNGMIDRPATFADIQQVFSELAGRVDADDELFLWITGHGYGYSGLRSEGGRYVGYLDGRASVDPGDEPDFTESCFRLRSLVTGGDYACNHGLNVWKVMRRDSADGKTQFYRNKYVSQLDHVYIEGLGVVSDDDVFIEYLKDYALGDTNRDGYIDTAAGEVFDFDGDGVPPYDPVTEQFDEDDWGPIDAMTDNFNSINTQVPVGGSPYQIFDEGHQGKLCIDLGYTGGPLHVDGRDEDNAGLFDWMDVNQDGDILDVVSVDEAISLNGPDLYDDDLAGMLDMLPVARMTIVLEPCMSGGFIWDLSRPNRVIAAATEEDAVSWGNTFIREFVAALAWKNEQGEPVDADADRNGRVSMMEAFNYAAGQDSLDEVPQYDDNGDGVSHTDPVPVAGDGDLGSRTYIYYGEIQSLWVDTTPVVVASVRDQPRNEIGDAFEASPFEGLLRLTSDVENRAVVEYDLRPLASERVIRAQFSGQVSANNSIDVGVRNLSVLIYAGNGVADVSDFQSAATTMGGFSYHPPTDHSVDFSFDVTEPIRQFLGMSGQYAGFRIQCTTNPNAPNVLTSTKLEVTYARTLEN
jgi:PKD repeat protein